MEYILFFEIFILHLHIVCTLWSVYFFNQCLPSFFDDRLIGFIIFSRLACAGVIKTSFAVKFIYLK